MQIQIDITGGRVPSGAILNDLKHCKFVLSYVCGLFNHHRGDSPWVNDSHEIVPPFLNSICLSRICIGIIFHCKVYNRQTIIVVGYGT